MGRPEREICPLLDDGQIVDLYWQRDETAIKETDRKYRTLLLRIAHNVLHDEGEGEECLNDTYLAVWEQIPPARPISFRAFIARIMKCRALDRYKERARKKRIPSELMLSLDELDASLGFSDGVSDEIESRRLGELINEYLAGLDKTARYLFIGRYYMGETVNALAKKTCLPMAKVYRELDRARAGLKEHLKRNGVYV